MKMSVQKGMFENRTGTLGYFIDEYQRKINDKRSEK